MWSLTNKLSLVVFFMVKMVRLVMRSWFIAAVTNSCANRMNSDVKAMNSIAKTMNLRPKSIVNSTVNGMKSFAMV